MKNFNESFDSLVAELQRKGYSKEYATKIAGKVAKEKGMIGHKKEAREDNRVTACRKAVEALLKKRKK